MPSHLTRHILRRILANEPILHRECMRPRRRTYATLRPLPELSTTQNGRHASPQQQRSFFHFSLFGQKKRDEVKEADLEPGIEVMMHYAKMERMRARLPPAHEVGRALTSFFAFKRSTRQDVEDTQAQLALQSLRYLRTLPADDSWSETVTDTFIIHATQALLGMRSPTASHVALAKELYDVALLPPSSPSSEVVGRFALAAYAHVLGLAGDAPSALDVVMQHEQLLALKPPGSRPGEFVGDAAEVDDSGDTTAQGHSPSNRNLVRAWTCVLAGFAKSGEEKELLQTLEMIRFRGYDAHRRVPLTMLDFYLRRNDVEPVKHWFEQCWQTHYGKPDPYSMHYLTRSLRDTLKYCLDHNQLDYGHHIVRQVLSGNPPKPLWDAIFVWAAGTGKGADEIGRMFTVMESSNEGMAEQEQPRLPDIATINGLVEFATSRNDPYLAERFVALGKERDIQPDSTTYVLQMKYRLKVNDIDGALIAYKSLQSMDLSTHEDVPTVNQLVVALCNGKRHDFDTIMNVVADLADRRARFEPPTVSTLSLLHLSRDEVHDVIDLLNTHSHRFSSTDRESIRNTLLDYCLDVATPTPRSWDGYTILRSIFDEMPRPQRTELMVTFFKRQRPDMAANVFLSMRTHSRPDTIPTVDTYVAAFLGSAKLRDLESLEVIHNQLKLDYNIDATTYLYNALIIGYTACGKPRRALDFWEDIVASKEGPTYNSIHIALRACEKAPFGDLKAQEIWAKLRKQNVELDQSLWASYVAALAGNGDTELAISTVEEADQKNEVEVDAFLLGSLFAGCRGQDLQAEIEAWAKEKYSHVWAELEKTPMDTREDGMRAFKIDRSVTP